MGVAGGTIVGEVVSAAVISQSPGFSSTGTAQASSEAEVTSVWGELVEEGAVVQVDGDEDEASPALRRGPGVFVPVPMVA